MTNKSLYIAGVANTEMYSNMIYNIENLRSDTPMVRDKTRAGHPFFHSQPQNFEIKIGADVTFPCYVNNKGI